MNNPQLRPQLTDQEFKLFQGYIEKECGISLDDEKGYMLESRLKGLVAETGSLTYGELFQKVSTGQNRLLRTKVVDAITTNETLWFRDTGPFVTLEEVFLPEMVRQLATGKPKVRIWSAACSTGQEPYSIAMVITDFCRRLGMDSVTPAHFEIAATDISTNALETARLGAYDTLSMTRGMVDTYRTRFFKQNQAIAIIDPALKRMVTFQEFNLQHSFAPLGCFDAIFCRNVAIYFSQQFKTEMFSKMAGALNPRGFFFLGTSETLTYYRTPFQAREHKNSTYYQT